VLYFGVWPTARDLLLRRAWFPLFGRERGRMGIPRCDSVGCFKSYFVLFLLGFGVVALEDERRYVVVDCFQRGFVGIDHVAGLIKLEFNIFFAIEAESAGVAFHRRPDRTGLRDRNNRRSRGL